MTPVAPGFSAVDSIAGSCGRHITWRCGAVTYGPPLSEGCSLLDGPARFAKRSRQLGSILHAGRCWLRLGCGLACVVGLFGM